MKEHDHRTPCEKDKTGYREKTNGFSRNDYRSQDEWESDVGDVVGGSHHRDPAAAQVGSAFYSRLSDSFQNGLKGGETSSK